MSVPFATLDDALRIYADAHTAVTTRLALLDEQAWGRIGQFRVQGNVVMERPCGDLAWTLLLDAVHHRGQLSTYLRPMGAKVPAIYGPSADTMAMAAS
jgi:uncharacterized damage-inducible protein DinB